MNTTRANEESTTAPTARVYWGRTLVVWLVASLPVWLFALFLWFIPRPNQIFKLFLFTGVVFMGVALIVCMLIHPVLVKFQRTGLHHYLLAYVIAVQPILIRSGWVLEFTLLAAAVLSPSVILFWWLYYNELKWLKI